MFVFAKCWSRLTPQNSNVCLLSDEQWPARNDCQLSNNKHTVVNSTCSTYRVTLDLTQTAFSPTKPWRRLALHKPIPCVQPTELRKSVRVYKTNLVRCEPRTPQQTRPSEQSCWLTHQTKQGEASYEARHFCWCLCRARTPV